jgi:preprotein translocase subunit SecA
MIYDVVEATVESFYLAADWDGLARWVETKFFQHFNIEDFAGKKSEDIVKLIVDRISGQYAENEQDCGAQTMRATEKMVALWTIDSHWKEHLLLMDHLKEGIHWRGYAQKDPLTEYQKESYDLFNQMIFDVKSAIVEYLCRTKVNPEKQVVTVFANLPKNYVHSEYSSLRKKPDKPQPVANSPVSIEGGTGKTKVGRNEPCPCGSGKKYKKCCG